MINDLRLPSVFYRNAPLGLAGIASLLLTSCGGDSAGQSSASSATSPAAPTAGRATTQSLVTSSVPADVFVNPEADFVKPTPDAFATAYVGWAPVANASGYRLKYQIVGDPTPTYVTLGTSTSKELNNLPLDGTLRVSVASIVGGTLSDYSTIVSTKLPRPATQPEKALFAAAYTYSLGKNGQALLIQKNGGLVFAQYRPDQPWNVPHPLNSGTKSFSCALAGFAKQDYPSTLTLDQTMKSKVTDWNRNASIALLDLLTLQSGLNGNPAYTPQVETLDSYHLAVNEDHPYNPGEAFQYDPLSFQNFALFFQLGTGGTYSNVDPDDPDPTHPAGQVNGGLDPVDYLQTKLFSKFAINSTDYVWARDAKGHPQMAGGASFMARDWMKYGQFMLQKGTWHGERLLSDYSVRYCVGNSFGYSPLGPGYINQSFLGYGISFWLNANLGTSYNPSVDELPAAPARDLANDPTRLVPVMSTDLFMAAGASFQRLYVVPSEDLVIVRFGAENSTFVDNDFFKALKGIP